METPDYIVPIIVMGFRCLRCTHEWVPRWRTLADEPKVCPKCKSPYWNRHRKQQSVVGGGDPVTG